MEPRAPGQREPYVGLSVYSVVPRRLPPSSSACCAPDECTEAAQRS